MKALFSQADNQDKLGEKLDEMCVMILDKGLHSNAGMTIKFCDTDFFLN